MSIEKIPIESGTDGLLCYIREGGEKIGETSIPIRVMHNGYAVHLTMQRKDEQGNDCECGVAIDWFDGQLRAFSYMEGVDEPWTTCTLTEEPESYAIDDTNDEDDDAAADPRSEILRWVAGDAAVDAAADAVADVVGISVWQAFETLGDPAKRVFTAPDAADAASAYAKDLIESIAEMVMGWTEWPSPQTGWGSEMAVWMEASARCEHGVPRSEVAKWIAEHAVRIRAGRE